MMIHVEEMRRRKGAGIVFSLFLGKKVERRHSSFK